ncbi:MAG: hypothetical protein M3N47_12295 [Chloroflexota bacterium]|nr:hypothetical protein [Chloroflexota bacterium]
MSQLVKRNRIRRHLRTATALAGVLLANMLLFAGEAAAQEFATEPYGIPLISADERGTLIDVPYPDGGLWYRSTVDPKKTYRVTLRGEQLGGRFILRYRQDNGPLKYVPAPHGTEVYRFTGASTIELLLFRGSKAEAQSYRVRSLSLEDCTQTCQTDGDLKAQIVSDTPGLADALAKGDTYGAAKMLLHWTASNLAWSDASEYVLTTHYKSAAEIYYDNFATGKRGVFCGGSQVFFAKVLELFDIPHFRLDYGDLRWFTHATVVVVVRDEDGKPIYRILDPTFGADYRVTATGRPLSVAEVSEVWRAGLIDRTEFHTISLANRRVVRDFDGDGEAEMRRCRDPRPATTGCGMEGFRKAWQPLFVERGYTTDDDGLTRLFAMEALLDPASTGVPQDFQDAHRVFQEAVRNNDQNVRVAAVPLPPEVQDKPAIDGAAQVGATLTANRGTWTLDPTNFDFSWARCDADGSCNPIPGATEQSYAVTDADARHRIELRVVARNEYGGSEEVRVTTAEPVPVPTAPTAAAATVAPQPVAQRAPAAPEPVRSRTRTPARTATARFSTRASIVRAGVRLTITNRSSRMLRGRVAIVVSPRGRKLVLARHVSLVAGRSQLVTIRLTRAARERLRGRRALRGFVQWRPTDSRSARTHRAIMLVRAR